MVRREARSVEQARGVNIPPLTTVGEEVGNAYCSPSFALSGILVQCIDPAILRGN